MGSLFKAWAVGLKSLVDRQQSAHYCHQLSSRHHSQHGKATSSKDRQTGA